MYEVGGTERDPSKADGIDNPPSARSLPPGVTLTYGERVELIKEYEVLYAAIEGARGFIAEHDQSEGGNAPASALVTQSMKVMVLLARVRLCVAAILLAGLDGLLTM
jgi:hypothetical protein